MINAFPFFKKIFIPLFAIMGCVLFFSCGLDVYYIIYPPSSSNPPGDEALTRVFKFKTSDEQNKSMDIFTGTTIFYRIYNNLSDLESDTSSISSANTEFSENGYNKLQTLGYMEMDTSNHKSPFVEKSTNNQNCEVRLFTEGSVQNPYKAGILVSGSHIMDGKDYAIPVRDNGYSFNFFSSDKDTVVNNQKYKNALPSQGDFDFSYSENPTSEGTYYVNAYAVSVGLTNDFIYKHSEVTYLGKILISKPEI